MKLNCLIIDDEPVARKGLEEYVRDVEFLQLVGKCENALKAKPYLEQGVVDLIFLDIQMPKVSGIEFLKSLQHPPMVIFTTAFSEYAVEGYALDILDYLVKPISFERFLKAVTKAREFYSLRNRGEAEKNAPVDSFFVKSDGKFEKVLYEEVLYVEAMQNYVVLHVAVRKLIAYMTMSGLASQLPPDGFLRVHKSFIVALAKVSAIEGNEVVVNGVRIPVSRNAKEEVVQRVLGGNLLKGH